MSIKAEEFYHELWSEARQNSLGGFMRYVKSRFKITTRKNEKAQQQSSRTRKTTVQ